MPKNAEEEGFEAALVGQPETANPYDLDNAEDDHLSWNDGWNRFHDDEAEADE